MGALRLVEKIKEKPCRGCNNILPLSSFGANNTRAGLMPRCRICTNAKAREYRKNNSQMFKDIAKKYKLSKANDLHYRMQMLLNASRQRSKNNGRENTLTVEQLKSIYPSENKCPIFGFELEWGNQGFRETSPSVDRINSSKGYTLDNVQIISWKANRIKSYATIEELETVINYMKSGG